MRAPVVIASICLGMAACASSEQEIAVIHVSSEPYKSLSCEEIASEAQHLARSAAVLAGAPASSDEASGDVIVWPAAVADQSSRETKSALARIKAQFDALEFTAKQKSCALKFKEGDA